MLPHGGGMEIDMKKSRGTDLLPLLPVLTVVCTFLAVGIIFSSVMSRREEERKTPDTDAVPDLGETNASPPDGTEKGSDTEESNAETETRQTTEAAESAPVQTIPVGIYTKSGDKCYRVSEYNGKWPGSDSDELWRRDTWTYPDRVNLICDLRYFAVFTSYEEEIDFTSWDETWVDRWSICGLDESYKIGFEFLILMKNGENIRFTVLSPKDTFKYEEYFELYLYDCVAHAHDSRYSHITEATNFADTRNVMIKITLRNGCYDIDNIVMTAFVYNSADDFDEDGFYCGANRSACVIGRE